ncbi:MAG TPA: hypothetical protein VGF35_00515 [Steroidobacteraceae bacterium]
MLRSLVLMLALSALGGACLAAGSAAAQKGAHGCLTSGNGYLRATIRGAMSLDVNWHNAEMECEGGPRPDGSGVRVAFAGPSHPDGRRLRLVFGVESLEEGHPAHDLPTNLTVIFEGEERLFATRGDDHCTVDELKQERVGALGGTQRAWRIIARGFCVAPASNLTGDARILVSSFDFAGVAQFDDTAAQPPPPASTASQKL